MNGESAILLINLGTPDSPDVREVREYLQEFLSDPRVLDISPFWRNVLLRFVILPFRPRKSAEAYNTIWQERGSPLLFHTSDLAKKVSELLQGKKVEFAMRYGNPSIPRVLDSLILQGFKNITVFPLYPQYASSSTGSSMEMVFETMRKKWNIPAINFSFVKPFYDHPAFIDCFSANGKKLVENFKPDHVLFSYHGLPERHIQKSESKAGHCLQPDDKCCNQITSANQFCYRAQCFATTRAILKQLGWDESRSSIAFQSRLGSDPWIKPFTDEVVKELASTGKSKRLLVYSPAFVADCLETLEEIGMRAKEDFIASGGEDLTLVPSLNSDDAWVKAVVQILQENQNSFQ